MNSLLIDPDPIHVVYRVNRRSADSRKDSSMESLLDLTYQALLEPGYDKSKLESLPQHLLAQMVQRAVQDKVSAERQLQELKSELRYEIDPPYCQDRVDDDMIQRAEQVASKWAAVDYDPNSASQHIDNVARLVWDTKTRIFSLHPRDAQFCPIIMLPMYRVISSALLLYRLCCLFPVHIEAQRPRGPEGYKSVWTVQLRHKATGKAVGFSEHKGAACVLVEFLRNFDVSSQHAQELLELINLLCDPRCPHPYDGLVAGSVA